MRPRNAGDVAHVLASAHRTIERAAPHAAWLFVASRTWQSPLRAGGGGQRRPKGDHSDPTAATLIKPDPLALVHGQYLQILEDVDRASMALDAFIELHKRVDPNMIERGRVNTDPGCTACGGPAPAGHRRSGMCDACRKAWARAGRPSLITYRRQRQVEAEQAAVRLHEHEQETA